MDEFPDPALLNLISEGIAAGDIQSARQAYERVFGPLPEATESFRRSRYLRDLVCTDLSAAAAALEQDPGLLEAERGIGETALHFLAVENALEEVRWLIERGGDVNTSDRFQNTPLQEAASLGHHGMLTLLVSAGANPAPMNHLDRNAVHVLVEKDDLVGLRLLGELSTEALAAGSPGDGTPLHLAVENDSVEMVAYLLAQGADPNLPNYQGWTALMIASRGEVANLLLAHGGDLHQTCSGENALHLAARFGAWEVADLLEAAGLDPDEPDSDGHSANWYRSHPDWRQQCH